ncbi:hypothetical protein BpHYR1_048226 [Brachionus plicatilis]|uniref:Uncharacterized protein n=1 Tax=Brachionus plicatilis TaxID=10195 RepID=A0A3M7QF45_BRAPC|nr:hypothetical protein BpHYR1_048226 [Brachionus plicatilis]
MYKSNVFFTKFYLYLGKFLRFFKKNKAINGIIIDPSEEIRFKPEKTHFFPFFSQQKSPHPFFLNYINVFIFEILSLKEQQLFKGFASFGTLEILSFIKIDLYL